MKTAAAARAPQGRVLVVEDERDVADLIRYNLTKEGYDLVVAPTGSDALKQAREVHPDLVLLDIMVPQLNGWEVCRAHLKIGELRDGFVEPRTVDVHVARLRAKFSAARLPPPGVETVRGVGYRFREPDRP